MKSRKGKHFINFTPAISEKASKDIRRVIRGWKLHLRSDKSLVDLSRMFNPIIRGWFHYYGRFYRSGFITSGCTSTGVRPVGDAEIQEAAAPRSAS